MEEDHFLKPLLMGKINLWAYFLLQEASKGALGRNPRAHLGGRGSRLWGGGGSPQVWGGVSLLSPPCGGGAFLSGREFLLRDLPFHSRSGAGERENSFPHHRDKAGKLTISFQGQGKKAITSQTAGTANVDLDPFFSTTPASWEKSLEARKMSSLITGSQPFGRRRKSLILFPSGSRQRIYCHREKRDL